MTNKETGKYDPFLRERKIIIIETASNLAGVGSSRQRVMISVLSDIKENMLVMNEKRETATEK